MSDASHSFKPLTKFTTTSTVYFRKTEITKIIWMWTLIIAFPIKVAVKNFLKGIRKCPQVIPARSNKGLGIDAHSRIVMVPYFCKFSYIATFDFYKNVLLGLFFRWWISSIYSAVCISFFRSSSVLATFFSSSISNFISYSLVSAAFLATKYGGSSPRAVPKPHRKASSCTASMIPKNPICSLLSTVRGRLLSHFPKWSKFHLLGSISGTCPQAVATMATLAMWGPRYRTKVWSPVPNPIEEATPRMIQ